MTLVSIQIPRWLMHPEVWRFVGFASSIVGLLCFALSTSFNFLFGKWNLTKISFYIAFSFIICLATLFAKVWQHSASLRLRAHMAFLVLTITAVYSFFFDKAVNGKPDAYSIVSCAAFAMMWLSLSRQIHCGFEVDLLYFFLGVLIVQLMKIKLLLGMVGACFSYILVILRSSLNFTSEDEFFELQDQNHVVIPVESQEVSADSALIMAQFNACIAKLRERNLHIIGRILEQVEEYSEAIDGSGKVIDHNLVLDALQSGTGTIDDLREAAKFAVAVGFEKECYYEYGSCRKEWLEKCLRRLLKLQKFSITGPCRSSEDENDMIRRWIKASNVLIRVLFPSERRLCDRVFFGLSSIADLCFTEICRDVMIKLLSFADAFAEEVRSMDQMFPSLGFFLALRDLIPDLQSLLSDDISVCLVNDAVTVQNRLREVILASYAETKNMIFRNGAANSVLPNGGVHPTTHYAMRYIRLCCLSPKNLEPILQECLKGADGAGTSSSFSAEILEILERELKTNSQNYKDPALCYFFIMNNCRYIENKVKEWDLGTLLTDDWVQNNAAEVQQSIELYYRSSWNKVLDYLKLDKNESDAPDVAAESMKEKLKLFNSHFMEMCIVQSTWFVFDEKLREEIRTSLKDMLLPAYGDFIGRIRKVLGINAYEYIKYTMFDIEARLKDLFYGSIMNQWPTEK